MCKRPSLCPANFINTSAVARASLLLGLLFSLALSSAGCGPSPTESICSASCDRKQRCGSTTTYEACHDQCVKEMQPYEEHGRSDFASAYKKCMDSLPCGKNDDTCAAAGFSAVDPNWPQTEAFLKCKTRADACPDFSDDYCFSVVALDDSGRAQAAACVALPNCPEASTCLEGMFKHREIPPTP